MMLHYRVYKSLPLDDFLDDFCFVLAHCGYYGVPVMQALNYLKKNREKDEVFWKQYFVSKVHQDIQKFQIECRITDGNKYYDIWLERKE